MIYLIGDGSMCTDKFLSLYAQVFDCNGRVSKCGRDKCIELIRIAKDIDSSTYYGSESTGFMNIDNMHKLKERLDGLIGGD